jgi:hypothetical protein
MADSFDLEAAVRRDFGLDYDEDSEAVLREAVEYFLALPSEVNAKYLVEAIGTVGSGLKMTKAAVAACDGVYADMIAELRSAEDDLG